MKDLASHLFKIAAFCFVAVGAGVVSLGLPIIDYEKETRVLQYDFEQRFGELPSENSCVPDVAKDQLANCKTALYMQSVVTSVLDAAIFWVRALLTTGIIALGAGAYFYGNQLLHRKRKNETDSVSYTYENHLKTHSLQMRDIFFFLF